MNSQELKKTRLSTAGYGACAHVATCNLNQWAMDFDGNYQRTKLSIEIAKKKGCRFRCGPELELSGYLCEDHFFEPDTYMHCWQSMVMILQSGVTSGIIVSVGMPVIHQGVAYNCMVWALDGKILLIRPKVDLSNEENYREMRWFTGWHATKHDRDEVEDHQLPHFAAVALGQKTVPFGVAVIECNDTTLSSETCQEMFAPSSQHTRLGLNGVEIIANGSASHHNLRKLNRRVNLIENASAKTLSCYLYANQQGCDGGRLYFDGCAMVWSCGNLLAQGSQFSIYDVEVVDAIVDIPELRGKRLADPTFKLQNSECKRMKRIKVDFWMTKAGTLATAPRKPRYHIVEEEIAYGPACWLWDYLRRSGASGFYLPLSGGSDSCSSATMVGIMTRLVFEAMKTEHAEEVVRELRKILHEGDNYWPKSRKEICKRLFNTAYLGNSEVSGKVTKARSRKIADQIGSTHWDVDILPMVKAVVTVFKDATGTLPRFQSRGGTVTESVALQNVQARLRMVFGYLLSQMLQQVKKSRGWLVVLGSGNVDEALTGYLTKYDCSSADINPIGGINKMDLKRFLGWAAERYGWDSCSETRDAVPTAELEPEDADGKVQTDENDLGMTYPEISRFGRLRKMQKTGPVAMYRQVLMEKIKEEKAEESVIQRTQAANKVKNFFSRYQRSRHKMTVLTPSYHAENYSPDDNRFDLRPFLYPWPKRQFDIIDSMVNDGLDLD